MTEMTPQAEYWRNRLMNAHGWAIAAELLLVGWLASEGDRINLFKGEQEGGANLRYDAIGFLVAFPIAHFCYQRYVRWIYNDRLAGEERGSTHEALDYPKRTTKRPYTDSIDRRETQHDAHPRKRPARCNCGKGHR